MRQQKMSDQGATFIVGQSWGCGTTYITFKKNEKDVKYWKTTELSYSTVRLIWPIRSVICWQAYLDNLLKKEKRSIRGNESNNWQQLKRSELDATLMIYQVYHVLAGLII